MGTDGAIGGTRGRTEYEAESAPYDSETVHRSKEEVVTGAAQRTRDEALNLLRLRSDQS
jgi:hypothetical protein